MTKVAVISVGRSDFGIYLPIMKAIQAHSRLELQVIAAAGHLTPQHGHTIDEMAVAGIHVDEKVDMLLASSEPTAMAQAMGLGIIGFSAALNRLKPDVVLVLGDRFEMHAAATAAAALQIPLAHIHGGELTEGAIDELFRHSITKLSQLHFVATEDSRQRVVQLGESPHRVHLSGAPALDQVQRIPRMSPAEFAEKFAIPLAEPTLLVTYHPVTSELDDLDNQLESLFSALAKFSENCVLTYPNADPGHEKIIQRIEAYAADRDQVYLARNLGPVGYFNLLRHAAVMIGNSSSGIIEAASFGLPVVNIGTRQQGRLQGANVIDTGYTAGEIQTAITRALGEEFQRTASQAKNPYGDGQAADRIVDVLETVDLDTLKTKRFYDLPTAKRPQQHAA